MFRVRKKSEKSRYFQRCKYITHLNFDIGYWLQLIIWNINELWILCWQACAPRYVFFGVANGFNIMNDSNGYAFGNQRDPVGTCYLTNFSSSREFSPCRTSKYFPTKVFAYFFVSVARVWLVSFLTKLWMLRALIHRNNSDDVNNRRSV